MHAGPEAGGHLSLRPHLAVTGGRGQPRAGGDRAAAAGHVHTHGLVPLGPHLLRPAPDRVAALADAARHPEAIGWVMTDVTNASNFQGGGEEEEENQPLDLSWPDTCRERITYLAFLPIIIPLWLTLPDTRKESG